MEKAKLGVLLAVALALILLVLQNTAPVQARFLWMSAEIPAILLLLLAVIGGFIAGLLVALLVKRGGKAKMPVGEK